MPRTFTTVLLALVLVVPAAIGLATVLQQEDPADITPASTDGTDATERAIFVGNNWEGTADVIQFDPDTGELTHVTTLDIIPDIEERMMEIYTDPERFAYFVAIRTLVGEGHNQYVDDLYTVDEGHLLVVSRPSLADVVGINITTGELEWRFEVDGHRSDHMAISPDGEHVAVSASTGNVVHVLDADTGVEVGTFPSGDSPHENIYTSDGERIIHASIGRVYTPTDRPILQDPSKGEQVLQIVDVDTLEVQERVDMGEELEEAGHPGMSSAVRPMTLTPDERTAYLQVSFFHGYVQYDLEALEVVDVVELPNLVPDMPREQYLLDSAHHGIAMNANGTHLCVSGTMSDYAAIVPVDDPGNHTLHVKDEGKSYWSTLTDDGEHCLVSWSGTDEVSVLSFSTGEIVDTIDVGDHPQRVRTGDVPSAWVDAQTGG